MSQRILASVEAYNNGTSQTCMRLLPSEVLSGQTNMACDEVMLQAADRGVASLRFYTWTVPTLSLGYFQAAAARRDDPLLTDVAWVRRPSGGGAILHHRELTYCLALPVGSPWQTRESWVCRFHRIVAAALARFGVAPRAVVCGEEKKIGDFLCFLHQTPSDLLLGSSKIVGSAQRKRHGALMQHGSILLQQSPHTPSLPGIEELAEVRIAADDLREAVLAELLQCTGWTIEAGDWTEGERCQAAELVSEKYGSASWNEKR